MTERRKLSVLTLKKCRTCDGSGETRAYTCNPVFGGIERIYTTEECAACNGDGVELVDL